MSTDAEKLAQIAALCDDAGYAGLPSNLVAQVRAILAEPGPAVPPHAIDRDAMRDEIWTMLNVFGAAPRTFDDARVTADRILALVQPVEGITLTSDEKRLVAWSLNHAAEEWSMNGNEREADVRWALAERFEVTS